MIQPRLVGALLWQRHVQRTSAILARALELLKPAEADEDENALNRKLFFHLLRANREANSSPLGGFDHPPVYEGNNLPSPDDAERTAREGKRPDFQWTCIDHEAADPVRGVRTFVIECKRLGAVTRSGWRLNENYVLNGVARFIREEYSYACDDADAAMVGYVQSMDFLEILTEVNAVAVQAALPGLSPPAHGWRPDGTSYLEHLMARPCGVTPFSLHHYWVDLRARRPASESRAALPASVAEIRAE